MAKEYKPVAVGDTITIILNGHPAKVAAESIQYNGKHPAQTKVAWVDEHKVNAGTMTYLQWQQAAEAQRLLHDQKTAIMTGDTNAEQMYAALIAIGKLTAGVKRLESVQSLVPTQYIRDAVVDIYQIRDIVYKATGQVFPEQPL